MTSIITQKGYSKAIVFLLLVIAVMVTVVYFSSMKQHHAVQEAKIDGVYLTTPVAITDFNLTDNAGQPFTKSSLQSHWTLMFFGFTQCSKICPTTLSELNKMVEMLANTLPAEKMPQIVMVSVDPERDTVEKMNAYVTAFNPHFIGVRAPMSQIEILQKQLHIVSTKVPVNGAANNPYTINHSAEIIVFNPDAKLQAYLSYPHKAEQLVKDYQLLLNNAS